MAEQGYYGTEDNPLAHLFSERIGFTGHTSDPSGVQQGDMWLRTDLDSGDKAATMRWFNSNGIQDVPLFSESETTGSDVVKVLPIQTTAGELFMPILDGGGVYSEVGFQHAGTRHGVHDNLVAIPDKAIHRWRLDDVNATVVDSIGNADGTVSGVTSTSSPNYQGGAAGDGDGDDDVITTNTLGDFGSNITTDSAVAFTVDGFNESASLSDDYAMGVNGADSTGNMRYRVVLSGSNQGDVIFDLRDANGNAYSVITDSGGHVDGNSLHRVLINKTANSGASGVSIYIADSGDASYTEANSSIRSGLNDGLSNGANFDIDWPLFAENNDGTTQRNTNCILDDVILYNDSLNSSERATDLAAQPAFG